MRNLVLLFFLGVFSTDLSGLQVSGLSSFNSIKPGEKVEVSLSLISDKDMPELIDLKLCDYRCNSEGQHFFEDAGKQDRSNLEWIKLSTHREIVNPGETKELFLTVEAPQDTSLNGSYWSVLLIEPSTPIQSLKQSSDGFSLQVKIRYAFHVVTDVGGGTPSLKIIGKSIEQIDGRPYIAVDVLNNGTFFLNPKMTVKLLNSQGKLEKTIETQSDRLYPGSSVRFLAGGDPLPNGKYTVFLLLDNGDGKLFGDTFDLNFP